MNSLAPFEKHPHLAVAVSGGADSMALVMLAQEWVQEKGGCVTALVVDHQLRPESTQEAYQVLQWLTNLGIAAVLLSWTGPKPSTRIQERARNVRYGLLEEWCQNHGVLHLLTAHHEGDQWETVMQRLNRGSGIAGLRGILAQTYRPFGRILRPLLSIKKTELINYLDLIKQNYIRDPSNENSKYERVRWRKQRVELENEGYNAYEVDRRRREACEQFIDLETTLSQWALRNLKISEFGYISLDRKNWSLLAYNHQMYFMKKILKSMQPFDKKTQYPTPGNVVERILGCLKDDSLSGKKAITAGDCYILQRGDQILITRENRHLKSCQIMTKTCRWDRFQIVFSNDHFFGETIESLGMKRVIKLKEDGPLGEELANLPSYVLSTLPCVINKDGIFVLHHMSDNALVCVSFNTPLF